MPVANRKIVLATSSADREPLDASAGERAGGQANSRGITDQSLASRTRDGDSPPLTCTPCVNA